VDPDGDVRTVTVRLLGRGGAVLREETDRPESAGTAFSTGFASRDAGLARARIVTARAVDALGLASGEASVALACPGDGSAGDVLCTLGALLDRFDDLPRNPGRRLAAAARAAAAAVVRAGRASADGRPAAVRRALGEALRHLKRARRLARRTRLAEPERRALVADVTALRAPLRALRAAAGQ
jgi:hypothetical protein